MLVSTPRAQQPGAASGRWESLCAWLGAPVDAASLAAFRVLFGLTMAFGLTRFVTQGWVRIVYEEPSFFFKYPGFAWVSPPPGGWMYLFLGALVAAALGIALGLFHRACAVFFFLGFTYLQLIDLTNYLNHYYLVVLLAGWCCLLPLGRYSPSLDVRRRPSERLATAPRWMVLALRFQVALVYVFAAWAKTGEDWLAFGQPMQLWMAARAELPLLGPWLARPETAQLLSWGGLVYDATIVGFLLWPRTRPLAYLAVLVFHGLTQVFFEIGMFPTIMATSTLIFFSPSWPRRLFGRRFGAVEAAPAPARPLAPRAALALAAYAAVQLLVPLRHHLLPGDVLWTEEGMRFAWKVMVREKNGAVTYHVRSRASGREWVVEPRRYLTPRQANEMAGQPDMIAQLARHVRADFARRGLGDVEVRAEAWVSLNGRPAALLIDPAVDLAATDWAWGPAPWILPAPAGPPLSLRSSPMVSR
jgi:vitamin K-dependent gamma-carboxylase